MKKTQGRRLRLAKETIRNLVPAELRQVGGGRLSCGGGTACDCSGTISGPCTSTSSGHIETLNCTPDMSIMQY
jgi:hypothetical protein